MTVGGKPLAPLAGHEPIGSLGCGSALTEIAAIVLHAGDLAPGSGPGPAPGLPERARFLNLPILMVGARGAGRGAGPVRAAGADVGA